MKQKTVFRIALGNSPTMRIIEFLIEGRELDYSLTDIAKNSGVGWTTLHKIWEDLESLEVVVMTRVIGRAKLFRINTSNFVVKKLIKIYDELLMSESSLLLEKNI